MSTGKNHEDLAAAALKGHRYRPPRVLARAISGRLRPWLTVNGQEAPLVDLSMNGVLTRIPIDAAAPLREGLVIDLVVGLADQRFYEGRALVARLHRLGSSCRVGLHLLDGFLNLAAIRSAIADNELDWALGGGEAEVFTRTPPACRDAVGRATHFVQFHKNNLDANEARLREMGRQDALKELAERALHELRAPWNRIREEAAAASAHLMVAADQETEQAKQAAKAYTESMLTPLLLDAPVIQRSYDKPLGYAGDYQTMGHIYRDGLEGGSIFAQVFHKLAVEEPLAAGVRTRKDLIRDWHREEYAAAARRGGPPFRATSVGSGPSLELAELSRSPGELTHPLSWTLVDQEEEALGLAYESLYPSICALGGRGALQCRHVGIAQFLEDPARGMAGEQQDYIYAVGLFDYLGDGAGRSLVRALYRFLAPGGLMVVGNALSPNTHSWFGEFVLDWSLRFRDKEGMHRLLDGLPEDAERELVVEPSEAYYLCRIRKPEAD